jgi:iron complex outermembrane recepter protein
MPYMRQYFFLVFIAGLLISNCVQAQKAIISGQVKGSGAGLAAASVTLLNATDSSWVRSEIADDEGGFTIKDLGFGNYLVMASALGYETGSQRMEIKDSGLHSCTIELGKRDTALKEFTIAAKKPFIEMGLGKMVVNIEGTTTTAGSTVLDLMRRLPGVTVDQNGNVIMRGKEGVLMLIDDRPTYLSGDELAAYLKAMTAEEVAQIELITQPGAKYDATGNTGVINIKLRKNKKEGLNGNVVLSYGQGIYFHRNESALLNYKRNKLSVSVSFIDMEAIGFADWKQNMNYIDVQTGSITSTTITHTAAKERFGNQVMRSTVDYKLTDKTTVGINLRGTYHPNTMHSDIRPTSTSVNNDVIYNGIATAEGFIRKDLTTNAYLLEKFSKQSVLEVNADYLTFSKKAYEDLTNTTYNSQMQPLPNPFIFNMKEPSAVNVYSVKVDHSYTFKDGMKLESGIKSSVVNTSDDVNFRVYENNGWVTDTGKTDRFLYQENITAGYVTLTRALGKKWDVRIGLRAEQTNAEGIQRVHNDRFERNYFSLFPTAYLTYKMDTIHQLELNYGRRIERPTYKDLNPFIYYSFQNNYVVGNPYLQPQYTNNIELKHSYKNMIISTLAYSRATSVFSSFLQVNDTTKAIYSMQNNIASNTYVAFDVNFNKDIFKWLSLNLSGSMFYAEYKGEINNEPKTVNQTGGSLSMNSQLNFVNGWKGEAYVNYVSKGRWSLTTTFDPNVYIGVGASKKVNDHFLVKFYANDPFNIYWNRVVDHSYNYSSDSKYRNASQLFSLSVTYNFGSKPSNERNAKSLDEADRVK